DRLVAVGRAQAVAQRRSLRDEPWRLAGIGMVDGDAYASGEGEFACFHRYAEEGGQFCGGGVPGFEDGAELARAVRPTAYLTFSRTGAGACSIPLPAEVLVSVGPRRGHGFQEAKKRRLRRPIRPAEGVHSCVRRVSEPVASFSRRQERRHIPTR